MEAVFLNFDSVNEQEKAQKAHDKMYFYINRAFFALKEAPFYDRERNRFEKWFGMIQEDHTNLNVVTNIINLMHDAFEDNNIVLIRNTDADNEGTYAYIVVGDEHRFEIHLCDLFFNIDDAAKIDSAIGTLIHELTHLAGDTEDYIYGEDCCLNLAENATVLAANNADNYQYYCESFRN